MGTLLIVLLVLFVLGGGGLGVLSLARLACPWPHVPSYPPFRRRASGSSALAGRPRPANLRLQVRRSSFRAVHQWSMSAPYGAALFHY